jgi:hypothetical protein
MIVYAEGYNGDGSGGMIAATKLEQVSYDGLVTEDANLRRATFDLAQARLRATFYSFQVDAEVLTNTNGDLIGVQHDILTTSAGFARIKGKLGDGMGNLVGLLLDSVVPVDIASGIAIRYRDGSGTITLKVLQTEAEETDTVTFFTPFADPGDDEIGEGCLVTVGEVGSEFLRLILTDIEPGEDLTANVTCIDEAPELFPLAA